MEFMDDISESSPIEVSVCMKGHQLFYTGAIESGIMYIIDNAPGPILYTTANDPIGKEWFFVPGDEPRSDSELVNQYELTRTSGVNFLLNVPPNKSGLIPDNYIRSLNRLRKNSNL